MVLRCALLVPILLLLLGAAPYRNDLSGAKTGGVPDDMQAVSGAFTVAEFEGQNVLELPGEPLDTFGLLFGPGELVEATATARVWGATSGRRHPEFGIGLGDLGGYRLIVLPGQKKLELRKGDDKVADAPMRFEWKPKTWTTLRLRVVKAGEGKWRVEGKAWPHGQAEPTSGIVLADRNEEPPAGRASLWGIPFSGQPIRFDDLAVTPGSEKTPATK